MFRIPKLSRPITRPQDENLRRRAPALYVLFAATFCVLLLSAAALLAAYAGSHKTMFLHRLLGVGTAIAVILSLYILLRRRRYFIAAFGLLGIYWVLATVMALHWGLSLGITILLYCTLIVLSGIVLGAAYSLIALVASIIIPLVIQMGIVSGHIHPDLSWRSQTPRLADLVSSYFVFIILGISSWLFNRHTDMALHRALRAEIALQREKDMLESRVEERTRELQAAQIDKMQQMYRFTQMGQFSSSLMHDLANQITTLSVDIEGMGEQQQSRIQQRIKRRIEYIDNMVQWAYDHINGKVQIRDFNVAHEIHEVTNILQYNARSARVQLQSLDRSSASLTLRGDPARFRQLIANLVLNAIDAHNTVPPDAKDRSVQISAAAEADGAIRITVTDHGSGIPADIQKKIFDPFYSTKHDGMGIGLFIVKQVVEEHFGGTIILKSKKGHTDFTVLLRSADHGA